MLNTYQLRVDLSSVMILVHAYSFEIYLVENWTESLTYKLTTK